MIPQEKREEKNQDTFTADANKDCGQTRHIKRTNIIGGSAVAQWLTNLTSVHEDEGLIPGLAQCVKDPVLP